MSCGIYKIENLITHNIYIGQSIHIEQRWKEHIWSSFNNKGEDFSSPIHQAIYKYGVDNFSFEIIEECSQEELNNKEKKWIKYYDSYNKGYNATEGGDNIGGRHSGKPVELYDMSGRYIKTLESAREVSRYLSVSYSVVMQVLYKQRKSCGGYQLKYQEDKITIIKEYSNRQGGTKQVKQFSLDGKLLCTYKSIAEASRITGVDGSTISKRCRGIGETAGGFIWRYNNENS